MNDVDLARLAELEQAATSGPWTPGAETTDKGLPGQDSRTISLPATRYQAHWFVIDGPRANADAAFIAALRNAAPSLIAEARETARLRDVALGKVWHRYQGLCPDLHGWDKRDPKCPACAALTDSRFDGADCAARLREAAQAVVDAIEAWQRDRPRHPESDWAARLRAALTDSRPAEEGK